MAGAGVLVGVALMAAVPADVVVGAGDGRGRLRMAPKAAASATIACCGSGELRIGCAGSKALGVTGKLVTAFPAIYTKS
jgi:hypothetical protein